MLRGSCAAREAAPIPFTSGEAVGLVPHQWSKQEAGALLHSSSKSPDCQKIVWKAAHLTRLSKRIPSQIERPPLLVGLFLLKRWASSPVRQKLPVTALCLILVWKHPTPQKAFFPVLYNLINQKYPSGLWKCSVTPGKDVSWRLLKCGPYTSSSHVPWAFKGVVFQACTATPLNQKLPFCKVLGPSHSCMR